MNLPTEPNTVIQPVNALGEDRAWNPYVLLSDGRDESWHEFNSTWFSADTDSLADVEFVISGIGGFRVLYPTEAAS